MADIDIERKESVGWLWWLLGLVLVGLVAFLLASTLTDDGGVALEDEAIAPIATEPMPEPMPQDQPAAVQQFVDTCAARQPAEMGLDHEYTSQCVHDLLAALNAVVPQTEIETLGLTTQMQEARDAAQRLEESAADETQHSTMTRNAFTSIATVVGDLQEQRYPALAANVGQLDQAAESVNEETPLLEQREAVQTFFARAGDALQGMNTSATERRPATTGSI